MHRALCANPAHNWTDLRQAAFDRLKSENTALLQRLSMLEQSTTPTTTKPNNSDANANWEEEQEQLVPRASWAAARGGAQAAR